MKRCPHCGGNVATSCDQCTYCKTIISTYKASLVEKNQQQLISTNSHSNDEQTPTPISNFPPSSDNSMIFQQADPLLHANTEVKTSTHVQKRNAQDWISFVLNVIVTLIFMSKLGIVKEFFSIANSPTMLLLALFCIMFVGAFCFYLLAIPVIIVPRIIKEIYLSHQCPHGMFHGNHFDKITGQKKCPQCQILLEDQLRQQQKQHLQQQLQEKYREQYAHDLANAIEKRKRTLISDSKSIHDITPQAFEDMVAILFRKLGYRVEQTPYSNDGGKDAIIYKDGKKYLVECKRYKPDATIGRPLMQKLHAAMVEEHANGGIFVASCRYTQEALDYGRRFNIDTIDLPRLLGMLSQHNNADPNSHCYILTCRGCGESVSFALWDDVQFKSCSNGHTIRNIFWNTSVQDEICPECGDVMKKISSPDGIRYTCSNQSCSRHIQRHNNNSSVYVYRDGRVKIRR